ncbi:MAG TPA: NAD-dependent epimerase/dehydratase family protein [Flavobacteriales bacterium]
MERHVLVTGGAGSIGAPFVRMLLAEQDVRVTVLDALLPEDTRRVKEQRLQDLRSHPRFTFVEGDVRDPAIRQRVFAVASVDVVVHLVTTYDASDPLHQHRVNVGGTLQVLEWMRSEGIPRMVLGSTTKAKGADGGMKAIARTPVDLHAAGALAAEEFARVHARLHGAAITVVRFGDDAAAHPDEGIGTLRSVCFDPPSTGFGIVEVGSR